MHTKQTLTGIIRSRVPSYVARQLAGEIQSTFAKELNQEGYRISESNFRTLYARARKQLASNRFNPSISMKADKEPAPPPLPPALPPTPAKKPDPLTTSKGFVWDPTDISPDNLI